MNPPPPAERRPAWGLLWVFGLLVAGITLGGLLYHRHRQAVARSTARAEIEAIADLKIQQIVNWRKERLADANLIRGTPSLALDALNALAQPESANTRQLLTAWLDPLLKGGPYERILLLDDKLDLHLVHPEGGSGTLSSVARAAAEAALRTRQVVVTDLHRSGDGRQVYLNFAVPLVVRRVGTNDNAPADRSAGVLVLKLNAYDFLFPLIQNWPTVSRTAETLLVRREGQEVLYLNELRHQPGTAMNLRHPLSEARLPAAMGLRGEKVRGEGVDYRGVRVVTAVRPVPDTPWVMVAKVDVAELYAPLRRETLTVGATALALLLASGLAITLVWRQHKEYCFQAQLEAESKFRALFEKGPVGMSFNRPIYDSLGKVVDFQITDANESYIRITSVDPRGKTFRQAFPGIENEPFDWIGTIGRVGITGVPANFEQYLKLNGCWYECFSYRYAEPDRFVVAFLDITTQKQAEAAIVTMTDLLVRTGELAKVGGWELDLATGRLFSTQTALRISEVDPPGEVTIEQAINFIGPEARPSVQAAVQAALDRGTPWDLEVPFITAKGRHIWLRSQGSALRQDGKVVKLHGAFQDITVRKQVEAELGRMRKLLLEGQRIAHLGSWEYIAETQETLWSEEQLRIYGLNPAEPSPDYQVMLRNHIHPDDAARLDETFRQCLQDRAVFELDHRLVRPDGSVRVVQEMARPYFDGHGTLVKYVGTTLDITERNRAEEIARQQTAELQARNEELERFNRATTGRELRVIELKQQVDDLAAQLGRPRPYPLAFLDAAAREIVRTACESSLSELTPTSNPKDA